MVSEQKHLKTMIKVKHKNKFHRFFRDLDERLILHVCKTFAGLT